MSIANKIIKDFNGETESIVVPHSKKLTRDMN